MGRQVILVSVFILLITATAPAQNRNQESTTGELQRQLDEMRSQMAAMQNRIAELESAAGITATRSADGAGSQPQAKSPDEHTSLQFKALTLTLGGFLESTILVRRRNENADIANTFSAIPLDGSSNAKLSEYRGSVRNSELSLLIEGMTGSTKLKGYVETDFLGAAPTANYVQSSSWTPRLRQLWAQFGGPSGWTVTAGQTWSLLTTNRKGIETLEELRPVGADGQYVVGFTWTREKGVRVTRNFNDKVWAAFAVENPESTYSAAFVSPDIMGLNTSRNAATGVNLLPFLENYSNGQSTTLAPDLLTKVAFEPGWGHFELKAVGRFFRDRTASTATTTGDTHTTEGYGLGYGALMPFGNQKAELTLEGLVGEGIGRYGASGLPDATIDPTTGALRPLRQSRIMGGVVYHRTTRLDLYAYGGDEYTARYGFASPTGTAAGYGSPLFSYAGCTNEVALNSCSGANRNISEATVGYWYRIAGGDYGRIEHGNQVVYMHRNLWSGIGTAPRGSDLVVYTTLRFYLP